MCKNLIVIDHCWKKYLVLFASCELSTLYTSLLFGFVFGKVRVNEWPLSWKLYFSLYGYKFDKYEGWTHPLMWIMIFEPIWL